MKRSIWLVRWRKRRAKMLAENRVGMSWNMLARKYKIGVSAVAKKLKKAKQEEKS